MKRARDAGAGAGSAKRVASAPAALHRHTGATPPGVGFRLLRVSALAHDPRANEYSVTLQELWPPALTCGSHNDIQFSVLANYMYDVAYLAEQAPHVFQAAEECIVVHGDNNTGVAAQNRMAMEAACAKSGTPSVFSMPGNLLPFGTHHCKWSILVYTNHLRLCIFTSNFIYKDFETMTNAVWCQDFPLKAAGGAAGSEFESYLVDFLDVYKLRGGRNLLSVIRHVRRFDFSTATVKLVACVPGYHAGLEVGKWGHMRVRKLLKAMHPTDVHPMFAKSRQFDVIAQYSSQGAVTEKWLADLATSFYGSRPHATVKLVWPRVSDVREGLTGWQAGKSIPGKHANVTCPPVSARHHVWDATVSGHQNVMPHMKSFVGYYVSKDGFSADNIAFTLVTSCNMSKAAWGENQTGGRRFCIKSYELGVLFMGDVQLGFQEEAPPCTAPSPTPPPVNVPTMIHGDFVLNSATYLVHCCSTLGTTAYGISKPLFAMFPHADVYKHRRNGGPKSVPGTVELCGGLGSDDRGIANLMSQLQPGRPGTGPGSRDTAEHRLGYFKAGLEELAAALRDGTHVHGKVVKPASVAFNAEDLVTEAHLAALKAFTRHVSVAVYVVRAGDPRTGAPPPSSLARSKTAPPTPALAAAAPPPEAAAPAAPPAATAVVPLPPPTPPRTIMPLPYRLPPPQYRPGDSPWASDVVRTQADLTEAAPGVDTSGPTNFVRVFPTRNLNTTA